MSGDENERVFLLESEYGTLQRVQNRYTILALLLITSFSSMVMRNDAMKHLQGAPKSNAKYPFIQSMIVLI